MCRHWCYSYETCRQVVSPSLSLSFPSLSLLSLSLRLSLPLSLPLPLSLSSPAGIYGLSGNARNNFHHLRDLSYAGREYLAEHLNGVPPERHIFHRFCDALGVERRLVQAATRSRNPTAYLIQEYAQKDEDATFQRLEVALDMVGKRDLYVGLYDKLINGGFDDNDECN